MKTCMIIRHGALGDGIMASVILPYLKQDGYEITFYANERVRSVLEYDPNISHWQMHEDGSVPLNELDDHWARISEGFDKVVNLTGTVENDMMFSYPQEEYFYSHRFRRKIAGNRNYYDNHIERAGYQPNGARNPILYFNAEENGRGKKWRTKHRKHFKIVWALSGSSIQKVYRYFEPVCLEFLARHNDARVFTVGDHTTKLLTFKHPHVVNTMLWEDMYFRDSMLLTKYADLVIGPETGIINAAGAFDTPKICLLSHSGRENLTKYYKNEYSIKPDCKCHPCFILHKYKEIWKSVCELSDIGLPMCTQHNPDKLLERMEEIYHAKSKKEG